MNILEHYIIEVCSVKPIPHQEWMTCEWVEAVMMVNCYGVKEKKTSTINLYKYQTIFRKFTLNSSQN